MDIGDKIRDGLSPKAEFYGLSSSNFKRKKKKRIQPHMLHTTRHNQLRLSSNSLKKTETAKPAKFSQMMSLVIDTDP